MKIERVYSFPAPRQEVWDLLMDVPRFRPCIPGCEELEPSAADTWSATMRIGVAAVKGTYKGTVTIRERSEPSSYELAVEGRGAAGYVRGVGRVTLTDDGGQTKVAVHGDGQIGGTIAAVGQRMMSGVAEMLMNQFFGCVAAQLKTTTADGTARTGEQG